MSTRNLKRYKIRLQGTTALVLHNNQLVDPLHPLKKRIAAITAKGKKKTDADHRMLVKLEFQAGLYINDQLGPYIPAQNIRKMLIEGARKSKDGKQFESGLSIAGDAPIEYDGPRDMETLCNEALDQFAWTTPVGNQRNSVMRTRPRFEQWAIEFTAIVETSLIDEEMLTNALAHAELIGICDGRSINCGRFEASMV